ncbi:MAG: nicotinamidase-related amidase [Oceanicoccus sp.]|jgi:nicotinamidase-related amidase
MDLKRKALTLGKKPAIVLIDMINGFTSSECPLGSDCPEVIAANKILLQAFRDKGLPVFFTTVVYYNDDQATVFRERINALNVLTPDSDWVLVDPELEPIAGEALIEKCWASGFFKTNLDEQLRAAGADSIVVTGLTTSGCVRATVVDGLQNNYPVVVPEEAVGDRNQEAHRANLHDMHAKYAEVQTVQDVLDHLQQL